MSEESWVYLRNSLIPEGKLLPPNISRIAAAVEYNGRSFCGWQRQSHSPSIQQSVENALSFVADEPITVACAGRTDTGVHATNQVIHFDTVATRHPHNWIRGANSRLPEGIRIHWAMPVAQSFHARFSASSRTYRYIISNEAVPSALFHGLLTWCRTPLDEMAMHLSAQSLLGENDFSSYRASGCQSLTPFRNLQQIRVWRRGVLVCVEVRANAFLHHMVRNIVGSLMAIGKGFKPISWAGELLALKDRTLGEATAPPDGLYLVGVEYPKNHSIPSSPRGPIIVED